LDHVAKDENYELEVIGNTFDNLEFLGEGEDDE